MQSNCLQTITNFKNKYFFSSFCLFDSRDPSEYRTRDSPTMFYNFTTPPWFNLNRLKSNCKLHFKARVFIFAILNNYFITLL